jgi:hypothetical protein
MSDVGPADIDRVARFLIAIGGQYALIGGVAVAISGYPRYTADINALAIVDHLPLSEVFEMANLYDLTPRISDPEEFALRNRMLLLATPAGIGVDISLGALPFEYDAIANANLVEYAPGLFAKVVKLEALLIIEAVAWRERDIEDIRQLVRLNSAIDREYILTTFAEFAELPEAPERINHLAQILS